MSHETHFEQKPGYLHVTITGTNSRDSVRRYLDEIKEECSVRDCFRVLVEEQLEGPRLDAMAVFSLVSEGSMKSLGQFEAIAYVDEKMGDMGEFAETIAVNRGMPLAVFNNTEDATKWILQQKSGDSGRDIFMDSGKP
jgi:hypothetical protein